jgi:hypothetical protein
MTNDNDRIWLEALTKEKFDEKNPVEKEANLIRNVIINRRNLIESEILSINLANKIDQELLRDGFYKNKNKNNKFGIFLSFITGSAITVLATLLININSISTRSISNQTNIYSEQDKEKANLFIEIIDDYPLKKVIEIVENSSKLELTTTIDNIEGAYTIKISSLNTTKQSHRNFIKSLLENYNNEHANTIIVNIHKK